MSGMAMIPVATGELYDKISILEIKADRIGDPTGRAAVVHELTLLLGVRDAIVAPNEQLAPLVAELKAVNLQLWEIEDDIRAHEARQEFGASFIELARSVYRTNDRRARLKNAISALTGSAIVEQKSYVTY